MNGQDHKQDESFEARTRALFEESVDGLDGPTRSRLNQARQAALAELRQPSPWRPGVWVPAGAMAAAALLAVALWVGRTDIGSGQSPQVAAAPAALDDLELVAGTDDLDMLAEEPEFYAWAAAASDDMG